MMKKKTILIILKAIVSISLLSYIITNIDWKEVLSNLGKANFALLFVVFFLYVLEQVELTYKWRVLISARGIKVSLFRLCIINSIGTFWGLFLPSSVGTDVVRGYYLVKNNSEKAISVSSIFVDRISSMFSLLLLGIVFILLAGDMISKFNLSTYIIPFSIIITILFYLFQREKTAHYLKDKLNLLKYKKVFDLLIKLHFSLLEYKKYPKALVSSFVLSILVQLTRVMIYYFVAMAYNISVPIIYFFIFVPVIMLVLMIPISIGGLGVREGTFIAFFSLVGMSINEAVIISFTTSLMVNFINLLGGFSYLFYNSSYGFKRKEVSLKNPPGVRK